MIKLSTDIQLGTLIKNQWDDQHLFSVNRTSFDQMGYLTHFNKEFDNTFKQKDTLYIIVGTDSGLMVKELLKTPPEKGSAYLFIDFPEVIDLIQTQYDLAEQKRIIVTTEDKWEEDARKIGMNIYFMINKVKKIKSFAAQYYYLDEYLFLWQSIVKTVDHLTWQYQSQLGSNIFVQRQLENIAENHTPAISLKDYFKGKSALILAGGPSLDNSIEWIEENQEHFVVIAVTRIARRLLQTKIKPDIFVSVDPHPSNFMVSKEIFNFEKNSLLVHQYHLSPTILGNWLGINFYLGQLFPWKTKLNKENLIGIGPTVTNTAILLAINMGIKQQILFGVDLCYSPEGYTHALGSQEHEAGPDINSTGQIVITNKGEKAETNSAYFEAIATIEQLAELAQQSGGELINPAPDSAKIKDVKHILIEDIELQNEQISISAFLQQQFEKYDNSAFKVKHYNAVLKELKRAQFKVDKIAELANKSLNYNTKFFYGDNPAENFKYKLKMDKLEKELNNKDLTDFTELSKKFGVNEFLYFLNPDSDRKWTDEEIKNSADTYYKALRTGAIELSRHIFTAINRTEIRLLENNEICVDNEIIIRHLYSLDKSCLLDRKILDQQNKIKKDFNKQTIEQRKIDQQILKQLLDNKQKTIQNSKGLVTSYQDGDKSLGNSDIERKQAISFYLLMLQNSENYQSRRLNIFVEGNPELCFISEKITILDYPPLSYLNRQNQINDSFLPQAKLNRKLFIRNQLKNLTENHTPAIILKDCLKGKSALILADEASISEQIEWIEENQEYFVVIAVSKIAKYLQKTKIKPDILVATDYEAKDFEYNKEIFNYEQNTLLIHQNHLLPTILGNWFGLNLYLGALFPWKTNLNISNFYDDNTIKKDIPLKTINVAISLANKLGIKQQFLFGDEPQHLMTKTADITHESGVELLFPISDSAQANKITTIFLKKVQINKENINISELLYKHRERYDNPENKVKNYKKVLEELLRAQNKVKQINKLANIAIETLKNNLKTNTPLDEIKVQINTLENKLNHIELTEFTELAKKFNNSEFLYFLNHKKAYDIENIPLKVHSEINLFILGIISLQKQIFTAINRAEVRLLEHNSLSITKDVIHRHLNAYDKTYLLDHLNLAQQQTIIKEVKERVTAYQNHDSSLGNTDTERLNAISFSLLTEQYGRDTHTRRVYVLEKENPVLSAFSEEGMIFDIKTKDIKSNFKKAYLSLFSMGEKLKLDGLEIKLYNLFMLKDEKSIDNIIKGVSLVSDTHSESDALIHLAKGYKYELSNKIDQAITEYGYANDPKTLESALKRLAFISLNKGELENAHDVLQLLSEISPEYLPQLAELYAITKNYKNASDIYVQYLDYNMSDISVLIKVGKLYELQNITDGAQFIYNHILELEPENQIAKEAISHL